MTREELREHCEKQIEQCKLWAESRGEKPSGHVYEEHLLILELLKQEPCEDAISRADANKLVDELARAIDDKNKHYPKRGRDIAIIARDIERLPSVTPTNKPKWISASEELPKLGQEVLCYCQAKIYDVLKYTKDGWFKDAKHCYMDGFVVTWMPLPEPYKESEQK